MNAITTNKTMDWSKYTIDGWLEQLGAWCETVRKASEVIANEAKQFIVKLAKLQSLQSEIYKIIYESHGYKGAEREFDDFKITRRHLNDSGVLLGESLKILRYHNIQLL